MTDEWECLLQAFVAIVQLTDKASSSITVGISGN